MSRLSSEDVANIKALVQTGIGGLILLAFLAEMMTGNIDLNPESWIILALTLMGIGTGVANVAKARIRNGGG